MRTIAIIPALNEHRTLSEVVQKTLHHVDHVVVVDDGSKEPLQSRLNDDPRLTVVRHIINLGKGAALKTGVCWAVQKKYDAAVFLDADGQHDPNEIPGLLNPLLENKADIVFGVRKFHQSMPFVARLGNFVLTQTLRYLYRIKIHDTQSGYRTLLLSAYDKIRWESSRYAVETEMIVNVGKHKLRYAQVPITTIYHDKYKGTTAVDGARIMLNIIKWRLS